MKPKRNRVTLRAAYGCISSCERGPESTSPLTGFFRLRGTVGRSFKFEAERANGRPDRGKKEPPASYVNNAPERAVLLAVAPRAERV